jgi:hypothetical protein
MLLLHPHLPRLAQYPFHMAADAVSIAVSRMLLVVKSALLVWSEHFEPNHHRPWQLVLGAALAIVAEVLQGTVKLAEDGSTDKLRFCTLAAIVTATVRTASLARLAMLGVGKCRSKAKPCMRLTRERITCCCTGRSKLRNKLGN